MAEEIIDNQDNGTEDQNTETQAVTLEQFEALNKQLEESKKMFDDLKKAQSGSDNKVTELQKLLKQKEEAGKTEEQKFSERLAEIERERDQEKKERQKAVLKGLAIELLNEKKISAPKYLNRLIGDDEEETQALINDYIEERLSIELQTADEFAKKNGRKVQKSKNTGDMKTLDDYSDEEIEAMSASEFQKIQDRSRK